MSHKTNLFVQTLGAGGGPMPTHSFIVMIPSCPVSSFAVESFSLPSPQINSVSVTYKGEEMLFPASEASSGEFKVTIAEGSSMHSKWELVRLWCRNRTYNQIYFDIKIIPLWNYLPLPKVTLKYCYLKGKDNISFNAAASTEYLKWDATFIYNGIVEEINEKQFPIAQAAVERLYTGALRTVTTMNHHAMQTVRGLHNQAVTDVYNKANSIPNLPKSPI